MGRRYFQLNLDERRKLAKMSVREMAELSSRAPCTIYREISRKFYRDAE